MKPFLSIIIPIEQEGEQILDSLLSLDYLLSLSEFSYECVFMYMNASVESKRVCEKFSKLVKYANAIELKEHERWNGIILEGLRATRGNIRMFLEPSFVSVLSDREKVIQKIRDGYECVIATEEKILEGGYTFPKSIPRMLAIKEDIISIIEKDFDASHKRRVLFAEIVGFLLKHNIKVYAVPIKNSDISKRKETILDTLVHKKRLFLLKREHKKKSKKKL